ncbi:MAG TPA: RNA polymerase sigma factor [Chloroflexota bacterium]
MSGQPGHGEEVSERFLAVYDSALPYVYGYLLARCGRAVLAEELTADTMLAAVDAVGREPPRSLSTAWLLGIARHKLVDYWRRLGREERSLRSLAAQSPDEAEDPWDVHLDGLRARQTLEVLAPHHRAVLTLRYLDDLRVAEVAEILDRTVHATEALLVRARAAFRRAYTGSTSGGAGQEGTADA